jgi:D-alanyl-D-alanine carboxypeptidase
MNKIAFSFLAAAAILLFLAFPAVAQQSALADKDEVATAIRLWQATVESQMAYRGQPGISVGIVYDQELIWSHGFGFRDIKNKIPATPQTTYPIASITKLFTATAVLQLRDAGKLQLDDPVVKYPPWFKVRNEDEDGPVISIRHLLTHTSGLPSESDFPYWTDARFPTREQMIEMLPKQEAADAPETRWKYSNLAVALAGEVVAAVSGEPYEAYVQKHILTPLGMTSTSFPDSPTQDPQLAAGYGRRMPDGSRAAEPFVNTKALTPAAGLSSNVDDLSRFVMLQFRDGKAGGKQILKGSTLKEMHRLQWLEPDWENGQGLGFAIWRVGNKTIVGHGGILFGYHTNISFSPEDKIGVIVLTNSYDGDPFSYAQQFYELVAPEIAKAAAPPTKASPVDPAWNNYVGLYRASYGDSQVLILNGRLVVFDPQAQNIKGSLLTLTPTGPNTFKISGTDGEAEVGETLVFELAPDGKVTRMKVGANYRYPVR